LSPRRTLAQQLGLWWLVLALVIAPALGRMHLVLHGAGSLQTLAGNAGPHAHGVVGNLFAGHTPAECQLLDQLNHGGAATAEPARALAAPVPACPAAPHAQPPLPRALAAFQARAPPVV
jgi:hypothetical protein